MQRGFRLGSRNRFLSVYFHSFKKKNRLSRKIEMCLRAVAVAVAVARVCHRHTMIYKIVCEDVRHSPIRGCNALCRR